jgi:hypothetical protein
MARFSMKRERGAASPCPRATVTEKNESAPETEALAAIGDR